jgi:hypothetical protein
MLPSTEAMMKSGRTTFFIAASFCVSGMSVISRGAGGPSDGLIAQRIRT